MARIRTVKPELAAHEGMFDAEIETGMPLRFAWCMLFTVCDREGRFPWRPRTLKAQVLPHDELDFSRVLDAWLTRGFTVKYRVKNEWFGVIPTFKKHQVINNREAPSDIPSLDDAEEVIDCRNKDIEACLTRDPRDHSREADACATREVHAQAEGKGKEGRERKGKEHKDCASEEIERANAEDDADESPPKPPPIDRAVTEAEHHEGFQRVMAAYPKLAGAVFWIVVENHCRTLVNSGEATWQELVDGAERYAAYCKATDRVGTQFVSNPEKFFGDGKERWKQSYEPPKTKAQRQQDANVDESLQWLEEQQRLRDARK